MNSELTRIINLFQKSGAEEIVKNSVTEYIDSKISRNKNWKYFFAVIIFLLSITIFLEFTTSIDIPKVAFLFIVLGVLSGIVLCIIFTLKEIFYRIMKKQYKKYFLDKKKSNNKTNE